MTVLYVTWPLNRLFEWRSASAARGLLTQPGAGPHQPHPHRARRQPERRCGLFRPQPGEVYEIDHRAIALGQRGQLGEQATPCSFGIDPLKQLIDLVQVQFTLAG